MSENTKRLLTLLVAASMLFSMMPMGVSAQEQVVTDIEDSTGSSLPEAEVLDSDETATPETDPAQTATALIAGQPQDAVIDEGGKQVWFSFTPEQTAVYMFTSASEGDTKAAFYNSAMERITENDDGGDGNNFLISGTLTAGETYYLCVSFFNESITGSFPVSVDFSPLVSLEFAPFSAVELTNGAMTTDWSSAEEMNVEYFRYDPAALLSLTSYKATFSDGTVLTGSGHSLHYQEADYIFNCSSTQSPDSQWTAGNTYSFTAELMGVETQVAVTIMESPLVSLEFTPVSLIQNTNGYLDSEYNPETGNQDKYYYRYYSSHILERSTYTATFSDGTVLTGSGPSLYYQDTWYAFTANTEQSYSTPWTAGNTYTMQVTLMGVSSEVSVTIEEKPLIGLSFSPVSLLMESAGSWNTWTDPETGEQFEYYHYDLWSILEWSTYTATFSDGTVLTGSGSSLTYNGEEYAFDIESDQDGDHMWLPGNTYTFQVLLMDTAADLSVTITENPLVNLEFTPLSVTAGTNGDWTNHYNSETNAYEDYFHYDPLQLLNQTSWTATFTDGSSLSGSNTDGFYYDGQWYAFSCSSDQSYETPWTAGNTYAVQVEVMGKQFELPVTVTPSPLVSLEFAPLSVLEESNGSWYDEWNPETGENDLRYYNYSADDMLFASSWTATFSDGTVITGTNADGFSYNGDWYSFFRRTEQSYATRWQVGNTYSVIIRVMGQQFLLPVTITENPLVSLEFSPVTVTEQTHGYWASVYNPENDTTDLKYYYYPQMDLLSLTTYTATFSDGTVITGSPAQNLVYNGESYSFGWSSTEQSYENPWTAGNTYIITASVMGMEAQIPVTIEQTPLESLVISPVSVTEGTNGNLQYDYNPETQAYDLQYYYYNLYQLLSNATYTATFRDGTVLTGEGAGFTYEGVWYSFAVSAVQNYENQWTAGNTYTVTAEVLAQTAQVSVTIDASPLVSLAFTPVSVVENTFGDWRADWNPETGNEDLEYYYYTEWRLLGASTYTATFSDGTVLTGNGSGFSYQGTWYDFSHYSSQSYENRWTAGNSYSITVSLLGKTVQVPVTITQTPLESLTFQPVSVLEKTHGNLAYGWNPETGEYDLSYYYYNEWDVMSQATFTAVFTDGTVISGSGNGFEYGGQWYSFEFSSLQSYEDPWLAGNTYTMTASVMGKTTQAAVTVLESPLVSLSITPVSVAEYTHGYWSSDWDPETESTSPQYYYYHEQQLLQLATYTATFSDGTVLTGTGNGFSYQDIRYSFSIEADQSYNNPWTVGNTYTITVSIMGQTVQVPVTIVESPLVSLSFTPITVYEGTRGYMAQGFDPETEEYLGDFYCYNIWELIYVTSYTATFSDGTTLTGSGDGFNYQGTWYDFSIEADQSYENQWTADNSYTFQVTVMNNTVTVPVTIVPSPVTGISVNPVSLYENTQGYWESYTTEYGTLVEYYRYQWIRALTYTVTFQDGTSTTSTGYGFWYNGEWCNLSYSDAQSPENPWTEGNTYTGTVSVLGFSVQVPVTIQQTPVASIQAEPIFMEEYSDYGGWAQDDFGRYYSYNWVSQLRYTVSFKDGSSVTTSADYIIYNNTYFQLERYDSQCGETPWLVGSAYSAQISLLGCSADVRVEICKVEEDNGLFYIVQNDQLVIVDCTRQDTLLEIPASIDGVPVTGIRSLGSALLCIEELVIPDSVTTLSDVLFRHFDEPSKLKKLTLGSGITALSVPLLSELTAVEQFIVAQDNPNYVSYDGVIYDKEMTTMVMFPVGKQDVHVIPDSVTDVDILFTYTELFAGINVQFGAGTASYAAEDGIVYNADKTRILFCTDKAAGSYVMPDTVTSVAYYAFANSNLTEVTLSANLTGVVSGMFSGSASLETVTIPEGITEISHSAFSGCESLKQVQIPSTMALVSYSAFQDCEALEAVCIQDLDAWSAIQFSMPTSNPLFYAGQLYLQGERITDLAVPETVAQQVYPFTFIGGKFDTVTVPQTVYSIGTMAFSYADIGSLTLNEGLQSIEYDAFGKSTLKQVDLPDSLTSLSSYAFAHCPELESVTFGTGLQVITSEAFRNSGLKSVVIPENIEYVGYRAFANAALTEVTFESKAVQLGEGAFQNCPLGDLEFGTNVTHIDWHAFQGTNATQVKLPQSISQICYGAFSYSKNLVSVSIPDSVTTIENAAFEGDDNLQHVLYGGTEKQWNAMDYNYLHDSDVLVHYQATGDEVTTEQTCTTVRYYCSICDAWQTVQKPTAQHSFVDDVCTDCGLEGCWSYSIDTQTGSVTIIGYAGSDKEVYVPAEIEGLPVTAITYGAFRGTAVEYVELPATVSEIGDYAFADCTSLKQVDILGPVTRIGNYAFSGCGSLEFLVLPETVTSIGDYAFADCRSLSADRLPSGLTHIGEGAFKNCRSIYSLTIPAGVTQIAYGAFHGCSGIQSITLPDTVTSIGDYAFTGCYSVTRLTIPAGVTQIGEHAFAHCSYLGSITFLGDAPALGNAFTEVYASAFYAGTNETWKGIDELYDDNITWTPVFITVTAQPADTAVASGEEAVVTVGSEGSGLKHRWWYAAPGSDEFVETDQVGRTFRMTMDESCDGGSVYCVITDMYGQTAVTETATLQRKVVHVHDYTEDPTTCGTCGHVRMTLALNTVTLKSSVAGLYYKGQFTFDEETGNSILGYGIAVSLTNPEPVADGSDETCLYTEGTVSAVVANIMEGTDKAQNSKNARMQVYARAYVQLADGTYVYSGAVSASLRQMVQAIDDQLWSSLTQAQKDGLKAMYESFADVMAGWNIPNLKEYIAG